MLSCFVISFVLCDIPSQESACEPATPEPGFLMKALAGTRMGCWLEEHKTTISGWSNFSFTGSSAGQDQLPMGFNYRANEFLLQQNWLRIDRSLDKDSKSPSWGYHADLILPGSDYRFTVARGLMDNQLTANNGQPNTYGIDPLQFYAQWYLPEFGQGLEIKAGRFFAQYGLESIDASLNALASRSYTFIYNPFTHTGAVTTLKLNDDWSVQNGIVTGSDVFINSASNPTYIGSIKWAPKDGKASALFAVILGNGQFDASENFHNPQIFDLVLTYKLSEKLFWTGEALYGFTNDVPGTGYANWYGIVNYLTYQFCDTLSSTTRVEFFDDIQGQRTGYAGLYSTVTMGFTYKPKPWLWIRPEVRYDHNDAKPFEGEATLISAAFDVLIRW